MSSNSNSNTDLDACENGHVVYDFSDYTSSNNPTVVRVLSTVGGLPKHLLEYISSDNLFIFGC